MMYLTVVEFLMLEIHSTFFYKISPGLPFSMYIIMVRRKNALRNKITEKTEFVYFFSKFKNFTTELSSKIVTKRIINLGNLNDYMDSGHSEVSKTPLVFEILPTQTLDTVIS